jgi:hypothetical protein
MFSSQNDLINILRETVFHLNKSKDSMFSNDTVEEIKKIISENIENIESNNNIDKNKLQILFAPTGSIQDIAIDNGWGAEYLIISENVDKIISNLKGGFYGK